MADDSNRALSDACRLLPTRMLLQRVARARADGDWRTARQEWEACIARARERVVMVVDRYVRKGWIPASDHEDTVQNALLRASRRLVENLEKWDEGAFFAAVVQVADFQCRDDGRKHMKRQMREKSLDASNSWADDDRGRYDADAAREAEERWFREIEIREAGEWVDGLIAKLPSERHRKLLTLQRLGLKDAAIADELGVEIGNLYQLRTRALKTLRGLIDP